MENILIAFLAGLIIGLVVGFYYGVYQTGIMLKKHIAKKKGESK